MKKLFYKIVSGFFTVCNFLTKYPLLIFLLVLVIVAAVLVLMFHKQANVGGLIGKLFGFFSGKKDIEEANSIPSDRKQALGEADQNGYVQHKIEKLERSLNPFRDKSKIILPSGKKVSLPKGIKDVDIDVVIETELEIKVIPKKENYKKAEQLKKTLDKAKSTNKNAKDLLSKLRAKR